MAAMEKVSELEFSKPLEEIETVDILTRLSDRNLNHIIELICYLSGYQATVFLHCVCKSWNNVLSHLDIWRRIFNRKWTYQLNFRYLCNLNQWSSKNAKKVNYALTDFKDSLSALADFRVSGPSLRIFLGGLPNVMILHEGLIICGMQNGLIKIWKPEDADVHMRGKCRLVLVGHKDEVTCLSGYLNNLASGGEDGSLRIWDLKTGNQIRIIRMGIFSDIQGLALTEKYILTFHCHTSLTIGTASLWKIDGFQNIRENSVVFLAEENELVGGPPQQLMSYHVTNKVIAVALKTALVLFKVRNEEFLEQLRRVQREFESLSVSDTGQLIFCSNRTQHNFSLYHIESTTFLWSFDKLLDDPSNFIARSQLTEFGFCAILNDSRIMICPIDQFVRGDRIFHQKSLKFAKSSNVRIFPRLTGDPSLSATGLAFLVGDSEEVLFCNLRNFAKNIEKTDDSNDSLC